MKSRGKKMSELKCFLTRINSTQSGTNLFHLLFSFSSLLLLPRTKIVNVLTDEWRVGSNKSVHSGSLNLILITSTSPLSLVAPDVLVGAVTRLKKMRMRAVTPQLKELWLKYPDLSAITPETLLGAIRMLKTVRLYRAAFTVDQVTAVLAMDTEGSDGKFD